MTIVKVVIDKIPKNLSYRKWVRISVGLFLFGACFAFSKPVILQAIVRHLYVGTPGHYVRWKHESKQKFTYKLYVWNVTNPNEFANGMERPKLKEIGPYVFNQYKQKVAPEDNAADDTVSFNYWNIYRFNPELSSPLTGDETLTILNLVLTGAMLKVKLELPHMMNVAVESVDIVFKQPSSMFITMTAMDFIDKGIEIDCNQTAYAAKVACKELRKHKGIRVVDETKKLLRFRWFDHLNDTLQRRYTVKRGSRNVLDVGRVTAVNGEPMLKKNDILWIHDEGACKSFPLRFQKIKTKRGVKTAYKYYDPTDPLMNLACECNQFSGCAPKGTIDLHSCLDSYISASPPHFYLADPSLQDTVIGLNPIAKRHETGVYFDLLSSAPILAYERIQINHLVKKISEYPIFNSIDQDVWLPILWYEESYSIPFFDLGIIIGSIISRLTGVAAGYIFMTIGFVVGIALLVGRLQLHIQNLPQIIAVQPVDEKETEQQEPTQEQTNEK